MTYKQDRRGGHYPHFNPHHRKGGDPYDLVQSNRDLGGAKLYTSVSQIVPNIDNPTINQICYSMPANTILYGRLDGSTNFPKSWGDLNIICDRNRNCAVKLYSEEVSLEKYYEYAYYAKRNADGTVTGSGWKEIATTNDLTTLKTRQRWLTLAAGVSELFDDADYHPYAIVTSEYVHISGGFKTSADISASTPIITGFVPPAKKRWVPLFNLTKSTLHFGYINAGNSNLTASNLPAGNYVADFGYQKAYGDNF